ncbi:hypothetical protein SVAN01_02243 [Stagonosporopsis vannaccii]|nr:hypothetical protein SVAN01_02243 [Stagonosporopsis vannaccii]
MDRSFQESILFMSKQTTTSYRDKIENLRGIPLLPTEIWLLIFEYDDLKHLWSYVRNVSRAFRDCVERLFTSKYLQRLKVALSLPRRDPATTKLKWRGDPIPGSQLVMSYTGLSEDKKRLRLQSPTVVKDRNSEKTLEELRDAGTLPKERLEEAPTNVNMSTHPMASLTIKLPVHVDWDEEQKIWVWEVEWRDLLGRFFDAKDKQKRR